MMGDKMSRESGGGVSNISHVKLAVIISAFAMILSAFAFAPVGVTDADEKVIVHSWDELKTAVEDGPEQTYVILANDIIDDSDDDAVKIKKDRYVEIDLNGFKIDRQRGYEDGDDGRLFEISGDESYVGIYNGTLTGGHGDDGGCIYLDGATMLLIKNVIITGNYSDDDGGAIYSDNSAFSIEGGKVFNNACDGHGGAIYIESESYISLKDVEFYGNHADDGCGGALYTEDSSYELDGCNIHDNHCSDSGGAIYAEGGTDQYSVINWIDRSTISGNYTSDDDDCNGGAICLNDTSLTIDSSTFDGNHCAFNGGAIYSKDSDLQVKSATTFKNNIGPDSGGAILLHDGSCLLVDTTFENNHANACGGAIYVNNDATLWIQGTTKITGNSVLMDGGGLLVGGDDDNDVSFHGLLIIKDNVAERNGPNVFIRSGETISCDTLSKDSYIGVVLADGDGKFTSDYTLNNPDLDPATVFHSDDPNYYVAKDPDSGEAKTFKEGSGGDMSEDNTVWIVAGIIAAVVVIGALVYFFVVRKP